MLTQRGLAERLAAVRSLQGTASPPRPRVADRADGLARWLGAELRVADVGRVVLVERVIPLPPAVAVSLASVPAACYFDSETTGLSTGAGTVVFLAALGRVDHDRLVVHQFLLPDYPDEPALLRHVAAELAAAERIVTYNGRAFDVPLLTSRLTVNGLYPALAELPERHDDLLPIARRLWRRALGSARLADVERGVLGVRRSSDCPSWEVPGRWFGYLRGGSPDLLVEVLDHNLQDIASLALLEGELLRLRAGGWREAHALDHRGMAIELLRDARGADALEVLEHALGRTSEPSEAASLRRLSSRLLLAGGEAERAEAIWHEATRRASIDAAIAWVEVARIRERHRGDLRGALEATLAASRVLDLAFALGRGGSIDAIGRTRIIVDSRLRRLRRWVAAADRRRARSAA